MRHRCSGEDCGRRGSPREAHSWGVRVGRALEHGDRLGVPAILLQQGGKVHRDERIGRAVGELLAQRSQRFRQTTGAGQQHRFLPG